VVERLVANEKVEGSSPFARSIYYMEKLYQKKCIACDGNTIPFDTSEIHKYLKKVDGWDVKKDDDKSYFLEKKYKFQNFIQSQEFINKVSSTAEIEGHHPDISFGWGYAKIKIFTHAIKGLAESDFILAAKIDQL
jgi:4a-hydroxytetrahydrobiopterin dehydratase